MFEDAKHIDENGNEYWLARELVQILEYVDKDLVKLKKNTNESINIKVDIFLLNR